MLEGLFKKLKSIVFDDDGKLKMTNLLIGGAGAAAGAFLLGPALGLGPVAGALLGGIVPLVAKEVVLPMLGIGGNQSPDAGQQASGFTPVRQQTQQVAMDEPSPGNIPGRANGGVGRG